MSRWPLAFSVAVCSSGLCPSTPAGGAMSAAVTSPGPCLRRYITTGSSCSEETTSALRLRMTSGTSSCTPGPDAGDSRTGNRGEQRTADRVPDGVAETWLQRLDDEPRPEVADLLFIQSRTLGDEHLVPLSATPAI